MILWILFRLFVFERELLTFGVNELETYYDPEFPGISRNNSTLETRNIIQTAALDHIRDAINKILRFTPALTEFQMAYFRIRVAANVRKNASNENPPTIQQNSP